MAFFALVIAPAWISTPLTAPSDDRLELTVGPCSPGGGWTCTFTVLVRDPSLIFFRWNVTVRDGWDYPDQTGGGPLGKWTTAISVTVTYREDAPRRVCVQGWDGVSTKEENGEFVPDAPIACSDFLIDASLVLRPNRWSEHSRGRWVTAFLSVPENVDPNGIDPQSVELNGIPAEAWPSGSGGKNPNAGGHDWKFKVDRLALTDLLGPGVHMVTLTGTWEGGAFFAADEIEIL